MKKAFVMVTMGILFSFAVAGCSDTLSRAFYRHHPRSVEDLESVWGQPVAVTAINDDIEKRTYLSQSPVVDLKYRYFLIKDGMVLASGITDTEKTMQPESHQETVEFVASDLSKAYYARHRTTVDHLDRTWGKPCSSKTIRTEPSIGFTKLIMPTRISDSGGSSSRTASSSPAESARNAVSAASLLSTISRGSKSTRSATGTTRTIP